MTTEIIYDKEPWWFCQRDDHESCDGSALFKSDQLTYCPCECHQTAQPQPAPETGEWSLFEHYRNARGERTRILDFAGVVVAETQTEAGALQIIADHVAVPQLVEALTELLAVFQELEMPSDRDIINEDQVTAAYEKAVATLRREG